MDSRPMEQIRDTNPSNSTQSSNSNLLTTNINHNNSTTASVNQNQNHNINNNNNNIQSNESIGKGFATNITCDSHTSTPNTSTITSPLVNTNSPPNSTTIAAIAKSIDHNYSAGGNVDSNTASELNKSVDENGRARKRLKGSFEGQSTQSNSNPDALSSTTSGTIKLVQISNSSGTNSSSLTIAPLSAHNSNTTTLVESTNGRTSPTQSRKNNSRVRTKNASNNVLINTANSHMNNNNNNLLINNANSSTQVVCTPVPNSTPVTQTNTTSQTSIAPLSSGQSSITCSTITESLPMNTSSSTSSSSTTSTSTLHILNTPIPIQSIDSNAVSVESNGTRILNSNSNNTSESSSKESMLCVGLSPKVPPLKIVLGNSSSSNDRHSNSVSIKKLEEKVNNSFSVLNQANNNSSNNTQQATTLTSVTLNNVNRNLESELKNSSSTSTGLLNVNLVTNPTAAQHLSNQISSTSSIADSNNNNNNVSGTSSQPLYTSSGRVTRSSQRAAAVQSGYAGNSSNNGSGDDQSNSEHGNVKELRKRKNRNRGANSTLNSKSDRNRGCEPSADRLLNQLEAQQPAAEEDNESSSSSSAGSVNGVSHSIDKRLYQMPTYNCYHMYLNIRKQVENRRSQQMHSVQLKPPQNINQFLVTTGGYLLQNNPSKNRIDSKSLPVDMGAIEIPAQLLNSSLRDLYYEQEIERRRLRLQHHIEKEKLRLSAEQEILRVHSRAALATSNAVLPPLSACSIFKDEEIYNSIEPEVESESANTNENPTANLNENESETKEKCTEEPNLVEDAATEAIHSDSNANDNSDNLLKSNDVEIELYQDGKAVLTVLQNVHEKWHQTKQDILLRHKRESESLQAIQKLNWQWRDKEIGFMEANKSNGLLFVEDRYVPIVPVIDFELLPNL